MNVPTSRVVVACSFYFCTDEERAEITRRVFRSFAKIPGILFIGVGSEDDTSRDLFCEMFPEEQYVEYPQTFSRPPAWGSPGLRAKFDAAVQACHPYNPEWVFHVGSDDLAPAHTYRPALTADIVGVGGGSYLWQYGTDRYEYLEHPQPTGFTCSGGPLGFSRRYLDAIDWQPFASPDCEVGAERMARRLGYEVEARPDAFWQIKCRRVLNGIDLFERHSPMTLSPTSVDVRSFLRRWSDLEAPIPVPRQVESPGP